MPGINPDGYGDWRDVKLWELLHPIRTIRGRRAARWLRNRPPGYGENYRYRSYFDPEPDTDPRPLLRPMPADMPEPTDVITAFAAFTACKVCGYKARICPAAACPQRTEDTNARHRRS